MKRHLSDSNAQHAANNFNFDHQPKSIAAMVANAAKLLTPVWPLDTFIACNSLHGYESLHFEEAILESQFNKTVQVQSQLEEVNRQMIKWCSAFLDPEQSTIAMPNKEKGFYGAFISLAPFDQSLHQKTKPINLGLQIYLIMLNKRLVFVSKSFEYRLMSKKRL